MLRASIEELTALNVILQFTSVSELLEAAMKGFSDNNEDTQEKEKSDLCWKVLKTLKWFQSNLECSWAKDTLIGLRP